MEVAVIILVLIGMTAWLDKILGDDDDVSEFSSLYHIYCKNYFHPFVRLFEKAKLHIAQIMILI